MKTFLKINKQRIFVSFIVCFFFFFCILGCFPVTAFAHFDSDFDYQAPFGFLFNDVLTYNGYPFGAEFPFEVSTSASTKAYNAVRFDSTGVAFGQSLDSLDYVYLWTSGWVDSGPFWLYSSGIPGGDEHIYRDMADVLSIYGNFYLLHDSYTFKNTDLVLVNLLTQEFDFTSNGTAFNGIVCTLGDIYYLQNDTRVPVYRSSDASWIDQSYRNITLSRYVPKQAILVDFWLSNQFEQPTFLDRVTSGLTAVISWVGTVVTSIVSGELVALRPLVAIGIAVSALLLVWVFIRRSIWGSQAQQPGAVTTAPGCKLEH